jgi:hypothetical protein
LQKEKTDTLSIDWEALTVKKPYCVSRDLAKEVNDKYLGLMVTTEKVRCGRSVSEDLCSLSRRFLIT